MMLFDRAAKRALLYYLVRELELDRPATCVEGP